MARKPERRKARGEDLRPVEGSAADAELAALARALANPARVLVLRVLAREAGACGADLRNALGLSQPTVSQHLQRLMDVGLIRGDADGRRTCYAIEAATLRRLKVLVASL